ncbi:phosphodiester glycosidase family protein (plasmid) [Agrobacterium fabrum]|uniref:phosphodiester glycosidase family protein n=1 Tax=Agrobacterium fabrum TaxID=1176649 RepID=UPI000DCFCF0C|nr:phosphodiester glycosidase family protein [Agrobacterium fabrum]AYM60970.1 hypothetical protein At1D132_49630 [Agrobacterium fabrum]NSZ14665.1 phosphodiester glycosidase family protein [Agrobacterium fabrum]UXT61439.1 phosphodiester glycosidase family protein [Agrobacterium fabrum]
MSSIVKETVRLHSGVEANIAIIQIEAFRVEPFNETPPSDLVSKTEAGLAKGRLVANTYSVAHPAARSSAPESVSGLADSQIELWADRAVMMARSYESVGLATDELWRNRRGDRPGKFPVPIAHTDLMRLRSATLEKDEIFANANYFLFEPRELDTPFEAYGDPVAMVVSEEIVLYPPQVRRTSLVSYGSRLSIEKFGFDDVTLTLPGGVTVNSHPFGTFDARGVGNQPIALARYFGSLDGTTPAQDGVCEVAVVGRFAVAFARGGKMPIPRTGCVIRFPFEPDPLLIDALRSGHPVSYTLRQGVITEGIQTGPRLVKAGVVTPEMTVFDEEGMFVSIGDGDLVQPSPFNWKADWHETRAARLGAGLDVQGQLFFVAVEGQSTYASIGGALRGATLFDLAELLRERGAVEGMHLDGGGSTQLFRPFGGSILRPGNFCRGFEGVEADYDRPLPLGLRLKLQKSDEST